MPGIGDEIDGAMQHAAQPVRQEIDSESAIVIPSYRRKDAPKAQTRPSPSGTPLTFAPRRLTPLPPL
jgi:hypothetical protein